MREGESKRSAGIHSGEKGLFLSIESRLNDEMRAWKEQAKNRRATIPEFISPFGASSPLSICARITVLSSTSSCPHVEQDCMPL